MNFVGLVRMTPGLVNASHSLLEGQAVKLTFFAPCWYLTIHDFHNARPHRGSGN